MSVWKAVAQNVGNLAKHVAQAVVQEPVEIVKDAVGAAAQPNENQGMQAMEQGQQTAQQATDDPNQPKGFKTVQDYQRYQQLSGNKDEMEMAMLRKQLHAQYGIETNLESGMQRARMEYDQKEQQRKQVDEQKKEEKKMIDLQVKRQEDVAMKATQDSASAETKAWGAG